MQHSSTVALAALVTGVTGHGVMFEPPIRTSWGQHTHSEVGPSCAAGACLWMSQGCTIGCPSCTGAGTVYPDHPECDSTVEPTIKWEEKELRTYGLLDTYKEDDYTKHHPWRYPGSAPIVDPCGVAGGWTDAAQFSNGGIAPMVPMGEPASTSNLVPKLLDQTVWVAGQQTEVAWSLHANHGGGYQYRLCPAGEEKTEECFQKYPINFVGETQWVQFGHGVDTSNRTEIPAVTLSADRVIPRGSQWRRNPIPACNDAISGGALGSWCTFPNFEPPIENLYGFGIGACLIVPCTGAHRAREEKISNVGIVDKIEVPDVPAGDYMIQFRWDSEQTPQVWSSCGDVTIKTSGRKTKPFAPTKGCTMCCASAGAAPCTNCTACRDDKTGPCEYCWTPLPGIFGDQYRVPLGDGQSFQCLGDDAEANRWMEGGCAKCWDEEGNCDAYVRDLEEGDLLV